MDALYNNTAIAKAVVNEDDSRRELFAKASLGIKNTFKVSSFCRSFATATLLEASS